MRSLVVFSMLCCGLLAAGCEERDANPADEPSSVPEVASSSAREEPDPDVPPDSPLRFAQRREGAPPAEARCEDVSTVCVNEFDFSVFVSAPSWDHHWVLDYGTPNAPVREGATTDMQWMQQLEQGVRHVLAAEEAPSAMGRCGLAAMMPVLFGAPEGYFRVNLPPAPGEAPDPVTPAEANAALQAAYAQIGYETEVERRFFDDATMARMVATSLRQPIVTRRGAFVSDETTTKEALLFVLFSPESQRVYVLDRSTEHPNEESDTEIRQRQLDNQRALLEWLANIGETPVAFTADTACEIPEPVGGRTWRPLTPPWTSAG